MIATSPWDWRTQRPRNDISVANSRLPNIAGTTIQSHQAYGSSSCASMNGTVCAPKTIPNTATEREMTVSTCFRLIGFRGCFAGGTGGAEALAAIPAVRVEAWQDAVLHRATQQVD